MLSELGLQDRGLRSRLLYRHIEWVKMERKTAYVNCFSRSIWAWGTVFLRNVLCSKSDPQFHYVPSMSDSIYILFAKIFVHVVLSCARYVLVLL